MFKWRLFPAAFFIASCGQGADDQAARAEFPPTLVLAAQSVSLEFPLHFDPFDAPPGYIKVSSGDDRNGNPEQLISALVFCAADVAWIEKTSHTMSVVMPSEENAIWAGEKELRPTDEETIACIKKSANQPFFYRKLPNGIATYHQN